MEAADSSCAVPSLRAAHFRGPPPAAMAMFAISGQDYDYEARYLGAVPVQDFEGCGARGHGGPGDWDGDGALSDSRAVCGLIVPVPL